MMINPMTRRRERPRRHRLAGKPAPPAVVVGLAIMAEPLHPLAEWMPVGVLLEEIPRAAHGEGGLTTREVRRIRTWSANFKALVPQVRDFYARHCTSEPVDAALWYVLGTWRHRPHGVVYARLYELWEADHGGRPAVDLTPPPATQERR